MNRWIGSTILGQTNSDPNSDQQKCMSHLSPYHTLITVYTYRVYHNLFTQNFSWISSSPIFFISSTRKNNKKHMPIPSPHGSVLDLFKSSNHVATLRPVLHGGPAGSPLSSSSLRGRWGLPPVDGGFFLRKNWCLTLFNLQHRGFRWWLLTCWEGGAFWG